MLGKQHRKRLLNKSFGTADILAHDCTATGRPPHSRRISPRNSRFVPDSLEGARFELLPPIEKRFLLGEWELSCAGDKRRFRNSDHRMWDREFESFLLQQRVRKPWVPLERAIGVVYLATRLPMLPP